MITKVRVRLTEVISCHANIKINCRDCRKISVMLFHNNKKQSHSRLGVNVNVKIWVKTFKQLRNCKYMLKATLYLLVPIFHYYFQYFFNAINKSLDKPYVSNTQTINMMISIMITVILTHVMAIILSIDTMLT